MNKIFLSSIATFFLGMSLLAQNPLAVRQMELSNGMRVWLNEDHSQPKIYGAVVVNAGAIDCPDTGIAHYFEHIMFKGTDKIGTVDYAAEKVYLDSIEVLYSRLGETADEGERKAIQKEINRVSLAAADYAIPNEFTTLISLYGGTGLNAGTSYDYTVYFNTFSSGFLPQWAELNSERLISPVFRLFQGELETVYEEKNMGADNAMTVPLEKAIAAFAGEDNPYAYPIIGSTEHLKNPNLAEMKAFYDQYYVASNMGLILSGDFEAAGVETLLERTFGRIRRGEKPQRNYPVKAPRSTREDLKIKLNIPLIKASALVYDGPLETDSDAIPLQVATSLLSNGSTGLIDSLVTEHKIMMGMVGGMSFNHLGAIVALTLPKFPGGSLKKSEALLLKQIGRICRGDFSDVALAEVKRQLSKEIETALETIDGRSSVLMDALAKGEDWEHYLARVQSVRDVTREEVMSVAQRYFTDNYLHLTKQFGSYPKDHVEKPDLEPVVPKHAGEESAYARALAADAGESPDPKMLSLSDVPAFPVTDFVTLYAATNPVNDIFELDLSYHIGSLNDPRLELLGTLLPQLGTDSLSVQELGRAWQRLGVDYTVTAGSTNFRFALRGYEEQFEEALALLGQVLTGYVSDKQAVAETLSDYRMEGRQFGSGGTSEIFSAMLGRVVYADRSPLLKRLNKKELKPLKKQDGLLALLSDEVLSSDMAVTYTGRRGTEEVAAALRRFLPLDRATQRPPFVRLRKEVYDEPLVYLYDLPDSRQTYIGAYLTDPACQTAHDQALLELWGQYYGGGMSSVLFQEIREFRAYAYSSFGSAQRPQKGVEGDPGAFVGYLGTQADKADAAMAVMDSLLHDMPVHATTARSVKQDLINEINNAYPDFRELPSLVAAYRREGEEENPDQARYEALKPLGLEDIVRYQEEVMRERPIVWFVVGNKKTLDLERLSGYGRVIEWHESDLYRK